MKNKNRKPSVKKLLKDAETKAYKKFGQNFLVDKEHVEFMIGGLDLHEGDFVIEIGPGMGALTEKLIAREELQRENGKINYLALEIDTEKVIFLKENIENIDILNISVLEFNVDEYMEKHGIESYKIIGSLPFNISKKIIQIFSECRKRPERAVFMVQKEVGQDYAPDLKHGLTFLSVYLTQYWNVLKTGVVRAECFFPVPKVDGMNLVLQPKFDPDYKIVKFAKRAFLSPRKKLGNILNLDKENQYYNKRPHELKIEDLYSLYKDINSQ
ncbi:MAG: rRNA adenine dimethyltransferase family protein [bacterium]